MSAVERVETHDGLHLAVHRFGSGGRTLLVPAAGNAADFADLASADLSVVCYDARARGRSDPVPEPAALGLASDVADLEAVRRAVGAEVVSVLGTGYYAGVAIHHAATHPEQVDRLVLAAALTATAPGDPRPSPVPAPHLLARLDQLEADGLPTRDPAAFCREWRRVYIPQLLADPSSYDDFRSDPCACPNERPQQAAATMAHLFLGLGDWDWRDTARHVLVPTLVVHGDHDLISVDEMAVWTTVLPISRLWVVPGAARFPWVERRPAFVAAVHAFLRGQWPDGSS